jgi:hypothetical protein
MTTTDQDRLERALARFDAANAADPHSELLDGKPHPKELLYGQRMSAMLARYAPEAPEAVRLAVRCQHIRRWEIPRSDYPMTRVGYKQWRTTLMRFHADVAGHILREVGYDREMVACVQSLLRKEGLKSNPDTQLLEDVIGLVFLESYLGEFVARHADYDEAKFIDILRKTWLKMSAEGREAALELIAIPPELVPVVHKAVAPGGDPSTMPPAVH